jgi:uncharacterized membrane protein (UPF0127 family)
LSRKVIIVFFGLILVTSGVLVIFSPWQENELFEELDGGQVIFEGNTIKVEIADQPDERRRGLMNRESLLEDNGMLFIFDDDGIYSFWMKNVKFSIDIIWINSEGTVVHIEKNVPTCEIICPSYTSQEKARYVLEVESGYTDHLQLKKGSSAQILLP